MAKSKKAAKKSTVKPKRVVKVEDFKVAKEPAPFMTFKLTQQTFYWLMLLLLIFALAIWVLDIQLQTTEIINSIEATL